MVFLATLAASASAQALTLGDTAVPSGSTDDACRETTPTYIVQTATDAGYAYTIPPGGGAITSWSINTSYGGAGTQFGLIVVRPNGSGVYSMVGSDLQTFGPGPYPAVQTYTLTAPISVQAGDLIGELVPLNGSRGLCGFTGGALTAADTDLDVTPVQTAGVTSLATGSTTTDQLINMSVNLVQNEDLSVTQTVAESPITTGGIDVFELAVSNAGPASELATLTDAVPSGFTIDSVYSASGKCTVSGQTISCSGVTASTTIAVIASATSTGSYANIASVSSPLSDPNSANNISSAPVQVIGPPTTAPATAQTINPSTVVSIRFSSLAKLPLAEAKTVIRDLGCKVGKVTTKSSKSIHKGDVISTSARGGQRVVIGSTVAIVASSGKPAAKSKRKKKR